MQEDETRREDAAARETAIITQERGRGGGGGCQGDTGKRRILNPLHINPVGCWCCMLPHLCSCCSPLAGASKRRHFQLPLECIGDDAAPLGVTVWQRGRRAASWGGAGHRGVGALQVCASECMQCVSNSSCGIFLTYTFALPLANPNSLATSACHMSMQLPATCLHNCMSPVCATA